MSNIVSLSVYEMVHEIKKTVLKELKVNKCLRDMGSFMLWGPPGVGKSEGVFELAHELSLETGKRVVVHDRRLFLFNPVDFMGVPIANLESGFTEWLKPQLFDMDANSDVINILFLDEINAATPSVQACGYQLTWDKAVGNHKLPDNCIVIAAGNRTTDKSVVYKMPKALCGRLAHFEISADISSWKKWARINGIDDRIIAYISFKNESLFDFDSNSDDVAFPSPRSWAMVSKYIEGESVEDNYNLISARVGIAVAQDFVTYVKVYKELPSIKDIIAGKDVEVPEEPDKVYALSSQLVTECLKCIKVSEQGMVEHIDKNRLDNIGKYIESMPVEAGAHILGELVMIKGVASALLQLPRYREWQKHLAKYIV